jgi:Fe-S-cluster containining protein
MSGPADWDPHLEELRALYGEVDASARSLEEIHAARLRCERGCSDCCVDWITVFEVEAENIRRRHGVLLLEGEPYPPGSCSFLDGEGACRIYPDRPYVCRTQGLPLRWIGEGKDGSLVEKRDICPLNDEGSPIEELRKEECWSLGPYEQRLAGLQGRADGGERRRVPLRELWSKGGGERQQ